MMKKRLMCLFLALLMLALPLSGCGSDGGRIAADSRSGVVRILAVSYTHLTLPTNSLV